MARYPHVAEPKYCEGLTEIRRQPGILLARAPMPDWVGRSARPAGFWLRSGSESRRQCAPKLLACAQLCNVTPDGTRVASDSRLPGLSRLAFILYGRNAWLLPCGFSLRRPGRAHGRVRGVPQHHGPALFCQQRLPPGPLLGTCGAGPIVRSPLSPPGTTKLILVGIAREGHQAAGLRDCRRVLVTPRTVRAFVEGSYEGLRSNTAVGSCHQGSASLPGRRRGEERGPSPLEATRTPHCSAACEEVRASAVPSCLRVWTPFLVATVG